MCYLSPDNAVTIEFNEWELGAGFTIRYRNKGDLSCARLSNPEANVNQLKINGLRLGMKKSEVQKLLGNPTKKKANKWIYDFKGEAEYHGIEPRFGKGEKYFWQLLIGVEFEGTTVKSFSVDPSVQS